MKNQTETFNRKICSTKFKQSKIQTKCEINEALNDRRTENCLQNHPCWILNCVYACTNDASNHATFRFILFTLLTRSCSVGLSVFSYSQVLLFFFFFVVRIFNVHILCVTCVRCQTNRRCWCIETYVSTRIGKALARMKNRIKQPNNKHKSTNTLTCATRTHVLHRIEIKLINKHSNDY